MNNSKNQLRSRVKRNLYYIMVKVKFYLENKMESTFSKLNAAAFCLEYMDTLTYF